MPFGVLRPLSAPPTLSSLSQRRSAMNALRGIETMQLDPWNSIKSLRRSAMNALRGIETNYKAGWGGREVSMTPSRERPRWPALFVLLGFFPNGVVVFLLQRRETHDRWVMASSVFRGGWAGDCVCRDWGWWRSGRAAHPAVSTRRCGGCWTGCGQPPARSSAK